MKAFAIVIKDHPISEKGWELLEASHIEVKNTFSLERHDACTPIEAHERTNAREITWNYPWIGKVHDIQTGLVKSAYVTNNPLARVACFLSHYDLWKKCVELKEPILILEHDAVFIKQFVVNAVVATPTIVGINSPLGATRRAMDYHNMVQANDNHFQPVPHIDSAIVPQGLAGNSAYVINPPAAQELLKKVPILGAWPNDAFMCYQNFNFLRQSREYYTTVSKLGSTTSQ